MTGVRKEGEEEEEDEREENEENDNGEEGEDYTIGIGSGGQGGRGRLYSRDRDRRNGGCTIVPMNHSSKSISNSSERRTKG